MDFPACRYLVVANGVPLSRDLSSAAGPRQTSLASNGQSGVYVARLGFVDKNGHGNMPIRIRPGSVDDQSSSSKGAFPRRLSWPDLGKPNRRGCSRVGGSGEALYFVAETAGVSIVMTLVEPARNGLRDWAAHQS